jgi:hypothetical protein
MQQPLRATEKSVHRAEHARRLCGVGRLLMTASTFDVNTRAQFNGLEYSPVGAIFAVEGTVYPGAPAPPSFIAGDNNGFWCGFASGVVGGLANTQDGLWASPGVGYPAKTVPMWPSVQVGRANLNIALADYATGYYMQHGSYDGLVIVGSAWSQGAMVWCQTFFLDILPVSGTLHYLLPYVYRLYFFGDIFRCPGIAHGNDIAGIPLPPKLDGQTTGGIGGPLDYTVAQANMAAPDGKFLVYSFVNPNDLYADAPCGDTPWVSLPSAGQVEYMFFKIIMQPNLADIVSLATLLDKPIGDVEALINTGEFFGAGNNAGHYQYGPGMDAAINDALALGNSLPHQLGI